MYFFPSVLFFQLLLCIKYGVKVINKILLIKRKKNKTFKSCRQTSLFFISHFFFQNKNIKENESEILPFEKSPQLFINFDNLFRFLMNEK